MFKFYHFLNFSNFKNSTGEAFIVNNIVATNLQAVSLSISFSYGIILLIHVAANYYSGLCVLAA